MRLLIMICSAAGLLAAFWPQARAWAATEESFSLPNGLKVILSEQPGSPVISLRTIVNVGSADEAGRPEYGLAHFMEHMAFKGGRRYPEPGAAVALVERNGGELNAYTSNDRTVYYMSLPADQAALGLEALADLVFAPLYDPKEYRLEKEVVIEEIKRGRDNPDMVLMEEFFDAAYPGHPYGRPIIGYEETVRQASVASARAFHRKYYRPDNAILVIAGGFDSAALREPIERFFGVLAKPKTLLPPRPVSPPPPAAKPAIRIIESENAALAKIMLGFRGPAGGSPDNPSLDLLAAVLTEGKASRLLETVKDEKGLATDISAFNHAARQGGSFIITAETEPAKAAGALLAIGEELAGLVGRPPDGDELDRARALAEMAFAAGQESSNGLADQITEFETLYGDWRLRDAYLPQWDKLGGPELAQAARGFRPENMTVAVMLPAAAGGEAAGIRERLDELELRLKPKEMETAAASGPAFQEMRLKAGPRLLVMRDAALPLVTVRAAALGGLLAETETQKGLSHFMAAVWAKASEDKPAPVLARAAESLGASFAAFSGRNSVGLNGSFLSAHFREGLALFAEILTRPAFSDEDVEKLRPEELAQIKAQDEYLPGRAFRLLAKRLYPGGHPYSRDQLGDLDSVAGFKPQELKDFYRRLISPESLVLAVAGDVEPEKTRDLLDELLAGWRPGGAGAAAVAPPPAPEPPASPATASEPLDRAQTHLALGFLVPGLGSDEGPVLDVLAAYLSGMSGPLFRELRDQQSLAYTVMAGYNPGLNVGSFVFYIATDPAKVQTAWAGFQTIIQRLKTTEISPEDLEGAKRYLAGTTKIRLQTVSSRTGQTSLNSLYGLGLDYEERRLAAIEKVTAEEVRRAAERYLVQERGALAVLGRAPEGFKAVP